MDKSADMILIQLKQEELGRYRFIQIFIIGYLKNTDQILKLHKNALRIFWNQEFGWI